MVTASRVNQFKIPLSLTIIILLLFFTICAASFLYYNSQKQAIKAEKQGDLLTIAALKLNQLATWRENQIDDAQLIVDNIYFPYRIQQWLNNESISGLREEILSWMAERCSRADYKACQLLDVKGAVRLSPAMENAPLPDQLQGYIQEALHSHKPVLSDIIKADAAGHGYLYLLSPLFIADVGGANTVGFILFRIDPYKSFYPLLLSWPVRSATGETFLVRREGSSALFLNELRSRKNSALSLQLPLSMQRSPAVRAVLGERGTLEGIDYRGTAVLAAITAVPDSPWFLVTKIDEEEVLKPVRNQVLFMSIMLLALITFAGISIMLFWRQQQSEAERRQYALELERRNISLQYEYLKKYANDIILLFNEQGTILEANDRALSAYGYSREELLQMPVRQLRAPASRSSLESDSGESTNRADWFLKPSISKKTELFSRWKSARVVDVKGRNYIKGLTGYCERKKPGTASRVYK